MFKEISHTDFKEKVLPVLSGWFDKDGYEVVADIYRWMTVKGQFEINSRFTDDFSVYHLANLIYFVSLVDNPSWAVGSMVEKLSYSGNTRVSFLHQFLKDELELGGNPLNMIFLEKMQFTSSGIRATFFSRSKYLPGWKPADVRETFKEEFEDRITLYIGSDQPSTNPTTIYYEDLKALRAAYRSIEN